MFKLVLKVLGFAWMLLGAAAFGMALARTPSADTNAIAVYLLSACFFNFAPGALLIHFGSYRKPGAR